MTVKKLVGTIHLWLGLASGLIVFVISLTGCMLAFEQEIKNVTQPYRFVEPPAGGKLLPPSVLKAKAEAALPGKVANGVLYEETGRSATVGFYNADPEFYYVVYLNPFSGEVLKVWDEDEDFFHFILHGHYYLWLPEKIGQPVVASATLIFLVLLISGLVLWWPKNKSAAKQRFSIKWNAAWRRKNYDLHNVLGFYMLAVGMIFAITGLVWGFQWFSTLVYRVTGGTGSAEYIIPPSDSTIASGVSSATTAVDKVWLKLRRENPAQQGINLSFPKTPGESIFSYVNYRPGTYYKVDYHYYDQHTLKELSVDSPYSGNYADVNLAKKLKRMNYDIHIGAIWGLPGKILAFCASLVCASLPITGCLIWWGRRSKKRPVSRAVARSMA
ncbi:PepSY-associated TM helix domain-containing protein [Spirosoma endbachense]|uniref:PepSY domain-containing protein n=1 Tax=Spirosoma endbachense TaxID=2666025 RepID=A0A6P1W2F3_9BACT|nr:PepSY-associated TM helix domain-containing protein [Spirosoma endbachense]QHV99611.1 PepSY domain-containing protein [Spirosoma endbachense]